MPLVQTENGDWIDSAYLSDDEYEKIVSMSSGDRAELDRGRTATKNDDTTFIYDNGRTMGFSDDDIANADGDDD